MVEIETISRERAMEIIDQDPKNLFGNLDGGYWDVEMLKELISVSDRIIEATGRGHELWILRGDTEFKVSLL